MKKLVNLYQMARKIIKKFPIRVYKVQKKELLYKYLEDKTI
jgi:hypothetical protein